MLRDVGPLVIARRRRPGARVARPRLALGVLPVAAIVAALIDQRMLPECDQYGAEGLRVRLRVIGQALRSRQHRHHGQADYGQRPARVRQALPPGAHSNGPRSRARNRSAVLRPVMEEDLFCMRKAGSVATAIHESNGHQCPIGPKSAGIRE